jgi:transposase
MQFAMAPRPRDQLELIPTTLGDLIAEDHPLRLLDELLGELNWSPFNQRYAIEDRGRPPISPRILASVWVYANIRKVRSSRQLEYQLRTNVEFMWLAHGHQIDHSTLSAFRRENKGALKDINRQLIGKAKDLGVIKLAELYIDGTKIKANANRSRTMTAAKAMKLLEFVEAQIDEYFETAELADAHDDLFDGEVHGERLPGHLATLLQRKAQLEVMAKTCQGADVVRKTQGLDPEKNPFQLPVTDPDSRIMPNKEGGYAPNYVPVVAVEGEYGLIVSTDMINSPNEQDCVVSIVDNVEADFDVIVDTVCADAAFCTGYNIDQLEENRGKNFFSPHRTGEGVVENPAIREDPTKPVDESQWAKLPINPSTKRFAPAAFVFDAELNKYFCPMGKPLHAGGRETKTQSNGQKVESKIYVAESCDGCPALALCRIKDTSKRPRTVRRDQYVSIRERHREKMSREESKQAYTKRFSPGERIFGQLKEHFGLRRFQARGQDAVESEFGLSQLAHNLLRMTRIEPLIEAVRASRAAKQT